MSGGRLFRGERDGKEREPGEPFDWRELAERHGIDPRDAEALWDEAVRQAQGYAQGSKTVVRTRDGKPKIVGESKLLNERSIADLERIRDALQGTPVWINDLQFLIGEDGAIVIADVLDFAIGKTPSRANLSTIARLIEAARSTIAKKGALSP
jgi:hypothetical protein